MHRQQNVTKLAEKFGLVRESILVPFARWLIALHSFLIRHLADHATGAPSQYKNRLSQVWDSHVKHKTVMRPSDLQHGDR